MKPVEVPRSLHVRFGQLALHQEWPQRTHSGGAACRINDRSGEMNEKAAVQHPFEVGLDTPPPVLRTPVFATFCHQQLPHSLGICTMQVCAQYHLLPSCKFYTNRSSFPGWLGFGQKGAKTAVVGLVASSCPSSQQCTLHITTLIAFCLLLRSTVELVRA